MFSFKSELHYLVMTVKLTYLCILHNKKQTKINYYFLVIGVFYLFKFSVSGVSADGIDFLISQRLLLRIVFLFLIYFWKRTDYIKWIDSKLESKEAQTMIKSSLNSFDIGSVYNISMTHLFSKEPNLWSFCFWVTTYMIAAFLNKYMTKNLPQNWSKIQFYEEFKEFRKPYIGILVYTVLFPLQVNVNYWIYFTLIFGFSFQSVWIEEKKKIEGMRKKDEKSPIKKIREQMNERIPNLEVKNRQK